MSSHVTSTAARRALAGDPALAARHAPPSLPEDWPNRSYSRIVDAAGIRWHVQRHGTGPGLLLVHGTAASTHTWRAMLPALAESYEVLAMDLPGHGYSERLPDGSMSLPSLASALAELLGREGFHPRCAVGHSAGAAIVLRAVLDGAIHPSVIVGVNAALLPFGGGFRKLFEPMARLLANTHLIPSLLARRVRDVGAVKRMLRGTGSSLDAQGLALYQHLLSSEHHIQAVLAMMASWNLQPLLTNFPALKTPLHLIVGARDKAVSPQEADSIAALADNVRVTRLPGLGHLAHEENPGLFVELVAQSCPPAECVADG